MSADLIRALGAATLGLALVLTGCASTARITGDFGEYRSYRQTRLATTLEERLGASDRYLHDYPQGVYREEVRSWFAPEEKRYFKLAWNNLPRLRAYLDEMPRGPHAEAAADRITQLESRRIFGDRRDQRLLDRAQGFESLLADAAAQRREFLRELGLLVELLGATRSFDQPTSELASELLLRFRVREPAGHCEGDRCSKVFTFSYAVPEDKVLTRRAVRLELEIFLDRGLVQQITLSAPELLTRVTEAASVRAVPPGNPQARAEALGEALQFVASAWDESLPEASCAADPVSPIVLSRRCSGVRAEVVAGLEPGEPDRISVRAERRAAGQLKSAPR